MAAAERSSSISTVRSLRSPNSHARPPRRPARLSRRPGRQTRPRIRGAWSAPRLAVRESLPTHVGMVRGRGSELRFRSASHCRLFAFPLGGHGLAVQPYASPMSLPFFLSVPFFRRRGRGTASARQAWPPETPCGRRWFGPAFFAVSLRAGSGHACLHGKNFPSGSFGTRARAWSFGRRLPCSAPGGGGATRTSLRAVQEGGWTNGSGLSGGRWEGGTAAALPQAWPSLHAPCRKAMPLTS